MRRPVAIGFFFLVSFAGAGAGQSRDPSAVVEIPEKGGFAAELALSTYAAASFVDLQGEEQVFPGRANFALGVLRVSASPMQDFALGIQVPYRSSTYDDPGLGVSLRSRGIPGFGGFVAWSPSLRAGTFLPAASIEYSTARSDAARTLSISDEIDRVAATLEASSLPGAFPDGWHGLIRFQFEYGLPGETLPHHFEFRVQAQGGPTVARLSSGELRAFLVGGYRQSTGARQEGVLFHNRKSQGAVAGAALSWTRRGGAHRGVSLSALRDVWSRNALSGWRIGLTLKSFL